MLENIHWLGHASFKLSGEKTLYIDPWQLIKAEPADIILITHGHHDHCSPDDVAKIKGPNTVVVATADCAAQLGGQVQVALSPRSGLTGHLQVVKPGEQITVQGVAIETVPAYNIGKSFHPRESGWVGYVVTLNGLRIYHAGDTDHTPEMDAVRADVALLPVGGKYTMTAAEAAAAANTIKPRLAVPMHWGSIVGSEQDAKQFQEQAKVPVQILKPEK